jgi:hypothetical protein
MIIKGAAALVTCSQTGIQKICFPGFRFVFFCILLFFVLPSVGLIREYGCDFLALGHTHQGNKKNNAPTIG